MSPDEVEEKFVALVAPVLGEAKARLIEGEVKALDVCESLKALISYLKVSS